MKTNTGRPDFKARDKREARMALARWCAVRELIKENLFGCEVHISGIQIGICDNSKLLPVVEDNITEIMKFLDGEPNKYE